VAYLVLGTVLRSCPS